MNTDQIAVESHSLANLLVCDSTSLNFIQLQTYEQKVERWETFIKAAIEKATSEMTISRDAWKTLYEANIKAISRAAHASDPTTSNCWGQHDCPSCGKLRAAYCLGVDEMTQAGVEAISESRASEPWTGDTVRGLLPHSNPCWIEDDGSRTYLSDKDLEHIAAVHNASINEFAITQGTPTIEHHSEQQSDDTKRLDWFMDYISKRDGFNWTREEIDDAIQNETCQR